MRFLPRPLAFVSLLAVLCVYPNISSTPQAAQGTGGAMAMPDNCGQNPNQCSLKIWTANSFPRPGFEKTITFSNGQTLTCSSNGPSVARTCNLSPAPRTNADPHPEALRQQCADLKREVRELQEDQGSLQTEVDAERAYFAQAMQMTPARLDIEINHLRNVIGSGAAYGTDRQRLDFLMELRSNQLASQYVGPGVGATTEQMQARARKIVNNQQTQADDQRRIISEAITLVDKQIADLNCDNVPLPAAKQPAPAGTP
jgi:hypothetical protein